MFVVTTSKAGNVKKIENVVGICTQEELEVRFGEDFCVLVVPVHIELQLRDVLIYGSQDPSTYNQHLWGWGLQNAIHIQHWGQLRVASAVDYMVNKAKPGNERIDLVDLIIMLTLKDILSTDFRAKIMHDKKHPRFEVFDIDQIVEAMIKYAHSEYDMDSLDQSEYLHTFIDVADTLLDSDFEEFIVDENIDIASNMSALVELNYDFGGDRQEIEPNAREEIIRAFLTR